MNIDFLKVQRVIIRDEEGKVIDEFQLGNVALIKDKLTGTRLELWKLKEIKKEGEVTICKLGRDPKECRDFLTGILCVNCNYRKRN